MRMEPVLVTGATGYVGGRLVPRLLGEGHRVRAMGRSMEKLKARSWAAQPMVDLIEGDVLDRDFLKRACQGCWAAYYLVHSMKHEARDFAGTDRSAALNMVWAAGEAGLNRMIYLGGLVPEGQALSPHLESRAEVGRILASGPVPVTILRAAMILGSGSASFEIMRYLMDRLPVLVVPRWINNRVQPISIRNVLGYLAGCLDHDEVLGETFDIGGPGVLSYAELFQIYAEEAGLPRRWIIPVPFMSPRLGSYLVHLFTPVHASISRPLAEGLSNTMICVDERIKSIIPQDLMDCRRTIKRILVKRQQQIVETSWSDAGALLPIEWVQTGDAEYAGGTIISAPYRIRLEATPAEVWAPITRIGGETGWYFADWLWRLRGWIDNVIGGVGWKRGRRNRNEVVVGDALDFWRVLEVQENRRLLLVGELKAPGEIVLDFRIRPLSEKETELQMIGRFLPRGLWGLLYWYTLLPFHIWIFSGVLRTIAERVGRPVIQGPEKFGPGDQDLSTARK